MEASESPSPVWSEKAERHRMKKRERRSWKTLYEGVRPLLHFNSSRTSSERGCRGPTFSAKRGEKKQKECPGESWLSANLHNGRCGMGRKKENDKSDL